MGEINEPMSFFSQYTTVSWKGRAGGAKVEVSAIAEKFPALGLSQIQPRA